MLKLKKIAAVVAAIAMTAAMALNVSAETKYGYGSSAYGSFTGSLSINPVSPGKDAIADTTINGFISAPVVSAILTIRSSENSAVLFSDSRTNYNAEYVIVSAHSNSNDLVLGESKNIVGNGAGTEWSVSISFLG